MSRKACLSKDMIFPRQPWWETRCLRSSFFTLSGPAPCSQLVLKVAKDEADNANEVRTALSCPSVFTKVCASGSMQLTLRPDSVRRAHYLLSERVTRLAPFLQPASLLPAKTAALVAYHCLKAICLATTCKFKCRDLGLKWGIRGLPEQASDSEVLAPRVCQELREGKLEIVILDSNCCLPGATQASLLGPRRMASFWAMMFSLIGSGVVEKVQELIRISNLYAQEVSSKLTVLVRPGVTNDAPTVPHLVADNHCPRFVQHERRP